MTESVAQPNPTTTINPPHPPSPPAHEILNDGKGFAESLLHDAFNPGVHPQSMDATNYALIALFVCATAAFVAWNYSIHFIVIIALGVGLLVMMNVNRTGILEASAAFLQSEKEKKEKEEAKKLAKEQGELCDDDDEEDEDYEYIFVSDDDEEEEKNNVIVGDKKND